MPKHRPLIVSSMTLYWVLSGCSLQPTQSVAAPEHESHPTTQPTEPAQPEPVRVEAVRTEPVRIEPVRIEKPPRPFPTETLYSLLAAELAGSREQYDVALSNYVQQARETRDPQIAERATLIARYVNNPDLALEMVRIWVAEAPHNKDALANAAMTYLQLGQLKEAFHFSVRLLDEGGEPLFQTIAASASGLGEQERATLLREFANQLQLHPQDEQLMVGIGLLLQQQGRIDEAMSMAQQALKTHPRSIPAAILEANLLHYLKRDQEAIAKMASLLEFHPDNVGLRQQYARILTHHDLELAQHQFQILVKQRPKDADLLLSLGIIAMERKDTETARKAFEGLLDQNQHLSTAHYYLGRMAEAREDSPEAILHYLQVENGNDFLSATLSLLDIFVRQNDLLSAQQHINRVRLRYPEQSEALYVLHGQALLKHNRLDDAEKIYSEGIAQFQSSTRLLFARAMLHNQRNRLAETERDLRQVLALDPENVGALNSLGYVLADRTHRLDEARALLEKALRLQPNDPAILDSMGWLLYRLGHYPEALGYLRTAYSDAPTAEIAAHLGELLWVIGDKTEARRIWQEGLKLAPTDPVIQETLQRLKADL